MQQERRVKRLFAIDKFESSVGMKKSFVLVSDCEEDGHGLWVEKVLLLFRIDFRGSIQIRE